MMEKLVLKNRVDELQKLNVFIDELLEKWSMPPNMGVNVNLALEEVFSNIVFYAFDDDKEHDIIFQFDQLKQGVNITVTDAGKAFDPLQTPPPDDLEKPAEERHIGGLGIHFVRSVMDEISYKRQDNKNVLRLTKYNSRENRA
ncbi:MAG: ATP-binding protein [Bacteroidales bacterium]|mgnify:CR=1 FL=1|nr:ATP-binding protein [Bacteroidales bacterium]MCF8386861.1 ATP-binding protein [Bacteroidales bacterium]MCF8396548.1 ATP-binding protein [Bacteroidales bacterium]